MIIKNKNEIANSEKTKYVFWTLLCLTGLVFVLYGHFVYGSIVNVVERQEAEKSIAELSSKVLALETEYVKLKGTVTAEVAHDNGFVAILSPKFINIKTDTETGLSLNLQ